MAEKKTLVSYEAVSAAADSLVVGGQRATVRAVIAILGGGSPNAVLPHLQAWKAGRPGIKAADVVLDARIAEILKEQIAADVAKATHEAGIRLADLESDAEAVAEAGRKAEVRADELDDELVKAQAEIQQRDGLLAGLRAELDEIRREASSQVMEARADAAREREAAEAARQGLARAELRLEALPALEKESTELRAALDAERITRANAEKVAAVAGAEKAASSATADDYRARLMAAEKRLEVLPGLEGQVAELRASLDAAKAAEQKAIAVTTAEKAAAAATTDDLRARLVVAEERERELRAELRAALDAERVSRAAANLPAKRE
ncbi:DNA-binding protein [Cupriavidus sp. CuC1]|uniref:DNA-binding protein n=1 Tax=Cupriavidus sp. CuC1 TaxID=3373131 RepID=UPI0037D78EA0